MADYDSYFSEGEAAGRDPAEIAASLGDPAALAAELRLSNELQAWRADSRPRVTLRMLGALLSLTAIHSVAWLPLVLGVLLVMGTLLIVQAVRGS